MNPLSLITFLISLLYLLLSSVTAAGYNATDIILLDCGATSNTTSQDGRNWEADPHSKYSRFNDPNTSFSSNASRQDPSVLRVPYVSALIIRSKFTFNFPVLPGPKFLRLYFYPETYSGLDTATSLFSVTSIGYTLLNNFSASLTAAAMVPAAASLIKEYVVPVWDNQILNVTFNPSLGSFAFINAIEIVSLPSGLYASGIEIPLVPTEGSNLVTLDNTTTALETMYRLNVGGKQIENKDDTGMYRTWRQDEDYLLASKWVTVYNVSDSLIKYTPDTPEYTAPKEVYTTLRMMSNDSWFNRKSNMTWIFTVDAEFSYLVRFHFCDVLSGITRPNQIVFNIFINNELTEELDVFDVADDSGILIHKDYIVLAGQGAKAKERRLDLHPDQSSKPEYFNAFLNGLEIFKLNRNDGSLAGPNPSPIASPQSPRLLPGGLKREEKSTILPMVGAILGGFALFSLLLSFLILQRRKLKDSLSFTSKFFSTRTSSSLPSDLCRHFSIAAIKAATQDFEDTFLIGRGGFGHVYKGIINDGTATIAIKLLNPSSRQEAHEFHTEIAMLSNLRHRHLVSLIGYCDDHDEMILVYDYMPRGTLRDYLDGTKNLSLSWKQRLEICIGAARGLDYLHREAKHVVIHRDVKSSNILLDENFMAKVSDFGLSKLGPTTTSETHVSTMVKGSFGYIDPEYYRLQRLTEKSDVYSFGVVLLEVLSGKPPIFQGLSEEKVGLARWASNCYKKGSLDEIVDPYLVGQITPPTALQKFCEVAENCVRERGNERPTMRDVVGALEFILQLEGIVEENANSSDAIITNEHSSVNTIKSQSTSIDN